MPYKQLFFRAEAREKIIPGAAALADAVRVTLGRKSKMRTYWQKVGRPLVCNDGVTIAKELEIKDADGQDLSFGIVNGDRNSFIPMTELRTESPSE